MWVLSDGRNEFYAGLAAVALAAGETSCTASTGVVYKSDAVSPASADVAWAHGVAKYAYAIGDRVTLVTKGKIRGVAVAMTKGGRIFASGTAGSFTQTVPVSTAVGTVQLLGICDPKDANSVLLNVDQSAVVTQGLATSIIGLA
jgi:hypothetical protein